MATYYWVGGTGTWNGTSKTNWATASGGAGGFGPPTSSDTVIFDASSGAGTCTTAAGSASYNLTFDSSTLTLTLGAAHTNTFSVTYTRGTINLGSNTFTTGYFASNNTNTRALNFGTGKIVVTGNAATVWNFANITNFAYTGTPTVELTYAGSTGTRGINHGFLGGGSEATAVNFYFKAGADTINGNGPVYMKILDFTGFSGTFLNFGAYVHGDMIVSTGMTLSAGSTSLRLLATSGTQNITTNGKTFDFPIIVDAPGATIAFQDALTMGSTRGFTFINGTVQLKSSATTTVGAFTLTGTNQRYLQSTTAGTKATLSQASSTVNATYLSIKDVAATGGAKWNALTACVNQQNNSGWFFSYQQGRPLPAFAF